MVIERVCKPNSRALHDREARRVDERVGALVVAPKPGPGVAFELGSRENNLQAVCALSPIEEPRRTGVMMAPPQKGPGLAENVIGRHKPLVSTSLEQSDRVVMAIVRP